MAGIGRDLRRSPADRDDPGGISTYLCRYALGSAGPQIGAFHVARASHSPRCKLLARFRLAALATRAYPSTIGHNSQVPIGEKPLTMFGRSLKNIDDVLWKEAGCTTELDYTEQTSWPLFLKYLDGLEQDRADEAALNGKKYISTLPRKRWWSRGFLPT